MKKHQRKHLVIALTTSLPFCAFAEEVDLFQLSLEELLNLKISVTSTKEREERNVLASVHTLTLQDWDISSGRLIFDTLDVLPGVDTQHSLGGTRVVSIRGYASTTQSARGKALLFDGIPMNGFAFGTSQYSKSTLPANLINSIEIVKGPISSYYGPDAFHGAINLNPWHATNDTTALSLSHGSRQDSELNAKTSYTLGNTQSTTNINYIYQQDAGLDAPNLDTEFQNKIDAFTLNQTLENEYGKLGVLYHKASTDDYYPMFAFKGDFARIEEAQSFLTYYKHELALTDDITLKPAVWFNDSDFALYEDVNELDPLPGQFETWHDRQLGAKTLAEWLVSDKQEVSGGIELTHSKDVESESYSGAQPPTENEHSQHIRNIYSAFIDYRAELVPDTLQVMLGLRHDYFSHSSVAESSPKLGFIWHPSESQSLKLIYAEGFRAPASAEYYGAGAWVGNEQLKGERLASTEAIYQLQLDRLKWTSSIYRSKWKDGIVTQVTDASIDAGKNGEYVNQGENSSVGFDTDLSYHYEPWHTLFFANAGYNLSKNDTTGAYYDMYPRFKSAIGARYEHQSWNASARYLSKYNRREGRLDGAEMLPDFHELNVNIGYTLSNYSFNLAVYNLLDHTNIDPAIWFLDGGIYRNGREARMTVSYHIR